MSTMDKFNVCQAHAQLESDYNVGGWLQERPSNQRRRESTSCQLSRLGFSNPYGWVAICAPYDESADDPSDEEVREIYLTNVLRWNLPIDTEMMLKIKAFFVPKFWGLFPQTASADYKQDR